MQDSLQKTLGNGADRAATLIENGLARAVQSGKLGFADLERTALSALSQIAGEAVKSGLASLIGESGVGGAGGSGLLGSLFGSPGRATGDSSHIYGIETRDDWCKNRANSPPASNSPPCPSST